jgi:hypothetical protein
MCSCDTTADEPGCYVLQDVVDDFGIIELEAGLLCDGVTVGENFGEKNVEDNSHFGLLRSERQKEACVSKRPVETCSIEQVHRGLAVEPVADKR